MQGKFGDQGEDEGRRALDAGAGGRSGGGGCGVGTGEGGKDRVEGARDLVNAISVKEEETGTVMAW